MKSDGCLNVKNVEMVCLAENGYRKHMKRIHDIMAIKDIRKVDIWRYRYGETRRFRYINV